MVAIVCLKNDERMKQLLQSLTFTLEHWALAQAYFEKRVIASLVKSKYIGSSSFLMTTA